MQRISKFPACGRYFDMLLLTHSRRQRYNKVLELQNNLKGNIRERPPKRNLQGMLTAWIKAGLRLIKEKQRKGADGNDHEHEITDNVFDLFE